MTPTTNATFRVPSTTAEAQATQPAVASAPTTTVDLCTYGPAPFDSNPATAGPSIPEEILTIHSAANIQRLELDSRPAGLSARLPDLKDRVFEFNRQI